jgi:hypothetical protein
VERDRADLEPQSSEDEQKPDDQSRCGLGRLHVGKDQLAGFAVDEADPVSQQAGGKDTQDEKFEAGFVRCYVFAQVRHEHVKAEGGKLQCDEDRQQVVGRGHEHHSQRRHHHQEIIFPPEKAKPMDEFDRGQDDQDRGRDDEHLEKQRHAVDDKHVGEERAGDAGVIEPGEAPERADKPGDAQIGQLLFRQSRE